MAFPSLLVINGLEFTDDGRTITNNTEKKDVEVELANGSVKKYRKAIKRNYSVSYEWLPAANTATSDQKAGQAALSFVYYTSDPNVVQIRTSDDDVVTMYAYMENYKEDLIRRDFITNTAFYNVSFDLREV